MQAARIDNAILLDYLTLEMVLEEPEIGSTNPNIPIDNNCMDDRLQLGMPASAKCILVTGRLQECLRGCGV